MDYRIAINGYGRIGQSVLRALYSGPRYRNIKVVAINELADLETLTYLTRYDTTHGRFPATVDHDGTHLLVAEDKIEVFSEAVPDRLPWGRLKIDLVMECTGSYTDRATAERHLTAGAKKLLFSQPADDDIDATIVYGFNHHDLSSLQQIVSNASCTTNCVVPVLNLIEQQFGIRNGVSTTIHSAMNDQPVIDRYHSKDLRLTRSAMSSVVPVETRLHEGIAKFIPQLAGKIESLHLRVPTLNVSLMDLSLNLKRPTTKEEINRKIRQTATGKLNGLLGYSEEAHASIDFNSDSHSAIVDGTQTRVSDKTLLKLMIWFDNEWSYACRMLDVAEYWLRLKSN
jgi:D-erythrose 4-phosphate dehydrogenase